jgi:hemin uptake protein HemP
MPTTLHPHPAPAPEAAPAPADTACPSGDAVRVVSSDALFAGASELLIEHHGARYRLRHTALGKLILTK